MDNNKMSAQGGSASGRKKDNELSKELYHIARENGTEPAFTGKYWDNHEKGMYRCAICGTELFSSDTKFDSGTGWPSFTSPSQVSPSEISEGKPAGSFGNVIIRADNTYDMNRTEVICKTCGAHLGHVFDDLPRFAGKAGGPKEKGGKRFCINSACLELDPKS